MKLLPHNLQIIWAAGLFDGEGSFGFLDNQKNFGWGHISPRASLEMTHEGAVRQFQRIVGIGTINIRLSRNETSRQTFVYTAGGKKAIQIARLLIPYLIVKYEQAKLLIEFGEIVLQRCGTYTLTPDTIAQRQVLLDEMKLINKRGA